MRKNIDLPTESVQVLELLAKQDGRPVKNYMERILIGHANDKGNLFVIKSPKKKKAK